MLGNIGNRQKAPLAGLTLAALALSATPLTTLAQSPAVPVLIAGHKLKAAAMQSLLRSVPNIVARAKKLNRLAQNTEITTHFCFKFSDPQGLKDYTEAVNDPNSLIYGQWLTPREIAQRFGPDPADYQAGLQFLKNSGLTVTDMPTHGMAITVKGTAAQMEKTFGVQLNEYQETPANAQVRVGATGVAAPIKFFAHDAPIQLPAALAAKVSGVIGLNNYARPIPHLKKRRDSIVGGPFTAAQARGAYDLNPLYNNNLRGQGRTVGISNFTGVNLANAPVYIKANNLPVPSGGAGSNISVVTIGQGNSVENQEADLDFQMILGMAPLANIIIYDNGVDSSGGYDYYGVLSRELDDNNADIITESYGWGFGGFNSQPFTDLHQMMSTAGITYLAASGDYGNVANTAYPYPDYEPDVLSIGGTLLQYDDTTGKYLGEVGWSGSGGGFTNDTDAANVKPTYQAGRGVPTTATQRLFPDISSAAAGYNGGVYYFYFQGGLDSAADGTSFASPVIAGQLALVEQYLTVQNALPANSAAKQRLGRLNDRIYAFNGRNDIFHDVTSGNNGFTATSYWDYVTGWGSLDMYNFAVALKSPLTVKVTPNVATVSAGRSVQLAATVTGSVNTAYTWSIASGPGTITSSGLYTAPATVSRSQKVTIQATSVLDTALPNNTKSSFQPNPVYGTATLNIPVYRTVSGVISLDGITDPGATTVPLNPFTFVLTPTSGFPIIIKQTLGAGGAYSLTNIPVGSYTLSVKGDKWLRASSASFYANFTDITNLNFALQGGDANNDNSVDSTDFGILIGAFNASVSVPGSGYDPTADFNNDGSVDSTDFGILISNFGQPGAN